MCTQASDATEQAAQLKAQEDLCYQQKKEQCDVACNSLFRQTKKNTCFKLVQGLSGHLCFSDSHK